ncbi:hypothetical protein EJ065_6451 [Corallococcus coralloides]|uniref:Uncharacterized protein n=1 Tax=Corallococcus coralloides TaxID=184914 RepID=A0A410S1F6_CORCK|nr:hypothetical protein EJ065_6451 [Corallococcus coralloides]
MERGIRFSAYPYVPDMGGTAAFDALSAGSIDGELRGGTFAPR